MAEILKIISPVDVKNRIRSTSMPQSSEQVFDLNRTDKIVEEPVKEIKSDEEGAKQELLKSLNRDILLPLLNQTKGQANSLRKLVLYSKLFEVSSGLITEDFLNEFFLLPQELLDELIEKDYAATVFKGDFFEALRVLVKGDNNPKLQESIISILKHFDSYVNQNQSLQAIVIKGRIFQNSLPEKYSQIFNQEMNALDNIIKKDGSNYREIASFLKNEFVPSLRSIGMKYPPADKINDHILSLIHYVVRYDKADHLLLEEAFANFAEVLKPMFPHLTDEDVLDMKETLQKDAESVKTQIDEEVLGTKGLSEKALENIRNLEDSEDPEQIYEKAKISKGMTDLLSKAFDKDGPAKINSAAQTLLLQLIQSESPVQPLLHFIIPLRFAHEDTYGEFFIDKDCKNRKGEASEAVNIFFTIQSDVFGTFEVDLLARDRNIELDIKCPSDLIASVKDIRGRLRETIAGAGYHLTAYQVGEYSESKTILKRFPELLNRKAGIDVRI